MTCRTAFLVLALFVLAASRPAAQSRRPSAPAAPIGSLPASFSGTLPCADCPGIRDQINLLPDHAFAERLTYLDRSVTPVDRVGTWLLSSDRRVIALLASGAERPVFLSLRDSLTLRALDGDGRELPSSLPRDLRRQRTFQPLDQHVTVRGLYSLENQQGRLAECATGEPWAITSTGAADELRAKAGGETTRGGRPTPVLVTLEGRVTLGGPRAAAPPMLGVERVVEVQPGGACAPRFAAAPLGGTEWRLVRLTGTDVPAAADAKRQPGLTFLADTQTFAGSSGCNHITGRYDITGGENLRLTPAAGTLMACIDAPNAALESAFRVALGKVRTFRVIGRWLDLFDEAGEPLARFEAPEPSK
jgi:copper homeostasis protein (lipoprotein)